MIWAIYSPIDKRVFNVVAGRIHKHATLVPRPALHANILVDRAVVLQATVANRDGYRFGNNTRLNN